MAELTTFDATADCEDIVATIRTDGAAILSGVLDDAERQRLRDELGPWIDATPEGRDDFTGRLTCRTGALIARSEASRDLAMHPRVLELANSFLGPFTNKLLLHLSQVIKIQPGSKAQPFHRDREAWGGFIPREIEPQFNTIWALTDFTTENGATRVIPGSPEWPADRRAEPHEKAQAEMKAGSVLLYTGSVIHSGGENRSEADRIGLNMTYTLSWLRTEENQFLSCPPEVAKDLDPDLQELLGYTMGNYALGYYSDPAEVSAHADIRPPESALGRRPRKKAAYSSVE